MLTQGLGEPRERLVIVSEHRVVRGNVDRERARIRIVRSPLQLAHVPDDKTPLRRRVIVDRGREVLILSLSDANTISGVMRKIGDDD